VENRSPGRVAHDAIIEAAEAKNKHLIKEKVAKRVFAECYLRAEGGNMEERKANALLEESYTDASREELKAASAYNLAKAKADAAEVLWEEWRTIEATKRAEMGML